MKHILLFGLLLAFTASCKDNATPSPEENVKDREVKRLLEEASALWSPSADSTFSFNDNKTERISVNDKKIWTKLDSALTIDPHNIKVYLGRTTYLMSCKKFHKILPILREAEKKASFNGNLWSLKAVFEDYYGDSLIAQKNYRSADSAYAIELEQHATDSLMYPAIRLSKTVNMALMTNDFALIEKEVQFIRKVFPQTWGTLDTKIFGKNKKEFFDTAFGNTLFLSPE